ncbi:hypothetical protein CDAR_72701 [Caerostris darwini]|uniref:Uncharacterized protein n=1 Tax=Caerostris darwini TaxID=1538125 RepID=A0AAV4MN53_9ARAC|nr:hypothetical protein CDAR_72701 [Caerostris darwini]
MFRRLCVISERVLQTGDALGAGGMGPGHEAPPAEEEEETSQIHGIHGPRHGGLHRTHSGHPHGLPQEESALVTGGNGARFACESFDAR